MKSIAIRFMAVLLSLVLLFLVLTGCATTPRTEDEKNTGDRPQESQSLPEENAPFQTMTDTEKAFYLWDCQESREHVESVVTDYTYSAKGEMSGYPFTLSGTRTEIWIRTKWQTYQYEESKLSVDLANGTYTTEMIQKSGFINGKMFRYESEGGVGKGVYSELSAEEWLEYEESRGEDSEFELTEEIVEDVTFEMTEKGYKAIFRGFTNEGIEQIDADMELSTLVGKKPSDCEIVLEVDKKLLPLKMSIRFLYDAEEGKDAPEFLMEGAFRDYNCAKTVAVNFSEYRKVDDLRDESNPEDVLGDDELQIVSDLENLLDGLVDCPYVKGRYVASLSVWNRAGEFVGVEEPDEASMSITNDDDGFYFLLNGNGALTQYEKGVWFIGSMDGYSQNTPMSETEAREMFQSWYCPAPLDISNVKSVYLNESDGTTVYSVGLIRTDLSPFQSTLDQYQMNQSDLENLSASYYCEVVDGKMIRFQYTLAAELNIGLERLSLIYVVALNDLNYSNAR